MSKRLLIFCSLLLTFYIYTNNDRIKPQKTLFLIYLAADNDLFKFMGRNLKEMQSIGSNEHITIVAQCNMYKTQKRKISRRFLIEKNKLIQLGPDISVDSGKPESLIDFCKYAIEHNPTFDALCIIFWNHGSGDCEPLGANIINPASLFNYNSRTKLIELKKTTDCIDLLNSSNTLQQEKATRGICYDETTRNYITNKQLGEALKVISQQFLNGKKIDLVGFDACVMAMIGVASSIAPFAKFMVASQQSALATGWNYQLVLQPFATESIPMFDLAQHIVASYQRTYLPLTQDFTQSAIDLSHIPRLEIIIKQISELLIHGLSRQHNRSVKDMIKKSHMRSLNFEAKSYIDLANFYSNLLENLNHCMLQSPIETQQFITMLHSLLLDGLRTINNMVFANSTGKTLNRARGISIYFPKDSMIDPSFRESEFGIKTKWLSFLTQYIIS